MLNEALEKLSRIGSPRDIAFVARWLSNNVTTAETLKSYATSTSGLYHTEVEPILLLFESMGLIKLFDGGFIECDDILKDKYKLGCDIFQDWFIDKFIEFALDYSIINIDSIKYSIADNSYIMSATTIKPRQHACYRNILIDYEVITLLNDSRYLVNARLYKAIKTPARHRKISEKLLIENLEKLREQGERGEMFVLEYEKRRITNSNLQAGIQRISIIDVSAGFDIVSYQSNESKKLDRFIEVKTYKGNEHFHWSKNEIDTARLMGESYYIYLVDDDCLEKEDYEPIIICNPIKEIYNSYLWKKTPDSYEIERTGRAIISIDSQESKCSQRDYNTKDIDSKDTSTGILKELVDVASKMDAATISSVETILSRMNDNHSGAYTDRLSELRRISDLKNGYLPKTPIVQNTNIENFNNNGTYNDNSISVHETDVPRLNE